MAREIRKARIQEIAEHATAEGTVVPVPENTRENPQPELLSPGQRLFLNKEKELKAEEALKEVDAVIAAFHKKGHTQGSIRRLLVDLCEPALKARGYSISRQETLNCHVVFGSKEDTAKAKQVEAKAKKKREENEAHQAAEARKAEEERKAAASEPPANPAEGTDPTPESSPSPEGGQADSDSDSNVNQEVEAQD